jgi:hypothetical protein
MSFLFRSFKKQQSYESSQQLQNNQLENKDNVIKFIDNSYDCTYIADDKTQSQIEDKKRKYDQLLSVSNKIIKSRKRMKDLTIEKMKLEIILNNLLNAQKINDNEIAVETKSIESNKTELDKLETDVN